jgi:carbon monoxide dehydrogenase subunit G
MAVPRQAAPAGLDPQITRLRLRTSGLVLLVLSLLLPLAASAQTGWIEDPQVQKRLDAGEVVVAATRPIDPARPRGIIQAAVRIKATPEAVWSVLTDCQQATAFVPGLRRCRRVDGAADGSWQDIEHEVRFSWLLPTVRYVFHAQYQRPYRIDFHRISGDLKEETGKWILSASADGAATVVQYDVYLDPGFWIPQFVVNRSLRKDLPAALSGLRDRVETQNGHASR